MYLLQAAETSFIEILWLWIKTIDQAAFFFINNTFTNSFFDQFFPLYRESDIWMPLYLFLLVLITLNFRWKSLPWILFFIITVSVCDQVSSTFLKEWFGRLRPCRDPEFSQYVRLLVVYCPGSGSFTSSHATNHFGMATFVVMTLGPYLYNWKWAFWVWAATIAYGQVYVGVHYPLDVIGGALLGILIGYASASFFLRRVGPLELYTKENAV